MMKELILKMSISADGFVGGPNGEIDWIYKSMDSQAAAWIVDTLWDAGIHIMGRRTFHDMVNWWPRSSEPFAQPMNQIPKAVFSMRGLSETEGQTTRALKDAKRLSNSQRLEQASVNIAAGAGWNEARVFSNDLKEGIVTLKREAGKSILAHGGASFAQSLVSTGLIDEYRLIVHPVILGRGMPLFAKLHTPVDLALVSTTKFPSGALANVYRPVSS